MLGCWLALGGFSVYCQWASGTKGVFDYGNVYIICMAVYLERRARRRNAINISVEVDWSLLYSSRVSWIYHINRQK